MARHSVRMALFALILIMNGSWAHAQPCGPQWLVGEGLPGLNGPAFASVVLPNGDIVVGGSFSLAGRETVQNIARWDGFQWSSLGTGVNRSVSSLALLQNGNLVVGGAFTTAGGVPVNHVASWDGTTWSSLGTGVDASTTTGVQALAVLPNGNLIAAGRFTRIGGLEANNIAMWDGTSWHTVGSGTNERVNALMALPNGEVLAGGHFTEAGGAAASRVAKWNGNEWLSLGSGLSGGMVNDLIVDANGDVIIGGNFSQAGGVPANHVARWDGQTWSPLGAGTSGTVHALHLFQGDLIVGGSFTAAGGMTSRFMARWDGDHWLPTGTTFNGPLAGGVYVIGTGPMDSLVVGGDFSSVNDKPAEKIALCDDGNWSQLGTGLNRTVHSLATTSDGKVIAGGEFDVANAVVSHRIATWNGTDWLTMGTGLYDDTAWGYWARSVISLPNGQIIAGGKFDHEGAENIAQWDGEIWSRLSHGTNSDVYALAVLPGGEVIAGGTFGYAGGSPKGRIAMWDGTRWQTVPGGGMNGAVYALAATPAGELIAGGSFSNAGGEQALYVARWDGTRWHGMNEGLNYVVDSLVRMPNGDIVAGGRFNRASGIVVNGIARWNGTTWSPLGGGVEGTSAPAVRALVALSNGDLIAGGNFTHAGGVAVNNIARWDGSNWSPLGTGVVGNVENPYAEVRALAVLQNGNIVAGGSFTHAGGMASNAYFATYSPSGGPAVAHSPSNVLFETGDAVTLFAVPSNGYSNVRVQWLRNGQQIVDGPGGASSGGGVVVGATATLASPTFRSTATLTIANAQASDVGDYVAVFSNACGEATSNPAAVSVRCIADLTGSDDPLDPRYGTPDGVLDIADFFHFVDQFIAGNLAVADLTGASDPTDSNYGVSDQILDMSDFFYYLDQFALGCP